MKLNLPPKRNSKKASTTTTQPNIIELYLGMEKFEELKKRAEEATIAVEGDNGEVIENLIYNTIAENAYLRIWHGLDNMILSDVFHATLPEDKEEEFKNFQESKWTQASRERWLQKVKRITEDEYEGQPLEDGDFYRNLEELKEHYESEGQELPEYVTVCDVIPYLPEQGIEEYLNKLCEDIDIDDGSVPAFSGLEELVEAWQKFAKLNKDVTFWTPADVILMLKTGNNN